MSTNTETNGAAVSKPIEAAQKNCREMAAIPEGHTHEMGSKLQQMILHYYADVRKQAQQSFYAALVMATVGTGFFLYGVIQHYAITDVSMIAGVVIQIISGLNFYLYGKAQHQFSAFHICLERTNRFLLANTLCENISCPVKKDANREAIITKIMDAPMLTLDVINFGKNNKGDGKPKTTTSTAAKPIELQPEHLYS